MSKIPVQDYQTGDTAGVLIGGERYITLSQVMDLLDVSETTLRRWMKQDFPKRTDRGRFLRSEVVEWFTRRT